jgi:hypothetical protein
MGRRRHMVPFKTTPFLLLFFSSYNAWNDAVLPKTRRFI